MVVEEARARAHAETGDDICLHTLEWARTMQARHGYQRVGKPKAFTGKGAPRQEGQMPRDLAIQTPGPGWGDVGSGPRPSWRDPRPLGDGLAGLIAKSGWSRQLSVAKLRNDWDKIVGPTVAKHAPLEEFEDGILTIAASSSAWAVNLHSLLPQVEKAIADAIGEGVVTSIKVKTPRQVSWKHGLFSVPGRGPRDTYD
ncbi:DUF721 domain-containing protein [Flaviflexus massiliensis]|uniref:DUF721 domain-containing protein n=1 Tax=Flaviflexus massiliensis TaxID=1522309 RepID=UPI0006D56EAA|nr:DciA family protein [Flaviflexus massiliensis]